MTTFYDMGEAIIEDITFSNEVLKDNIVVLLNCKIEFK